MPEIIDLHAHTTRSDGLDTPRELVQLAAAQGVNILAIADHDTVAGWDEAIEAAQRHSIGLIPAIEVSTHAVAESGRRMSVHILAYLPDPHNPQLAEALEKTRSSRMVRAKAMADLLAADYPITWEGVLAGVEKGSTIGRPALADALVRAGVVPNRSDAFESILNSKSKYYISEHTLDTVSAIKLVRAAGGVPIMAHPLTELPPGASRDDLPEAGFLKLVDAGLAGFEVEHRLVPKNARAWLFELAQKHNLITTGSSDYHGLKGKDNRLGENSTSREMLERIIDQAVGFEPLLGA